jgi:ribosomal protein S12 methylthiotransferase
MNEMKTYFIHSLGCNKNSVDSEILMTLLSERGYVRVEQPDEASRIIVNTCAFIDEAKEEAVESILALAAFVKGNGSLVVTGCMPQLYEEEIKNNMPEVDVIAGSADMAALVDAIDAETGHRDFPATRVIPSQYENKTLRTEFLSNNGYAYVKISEGCNRTCSFCLIPHIKGGLRSRSITEILLEAKHLEKQGIGELILTSQDTLSFGLDRDARNGLRNLLEQLIEQTSIPFIRLLYLRPSDTLLKLLELFKNSRVLPYFDIPVQHASDRVLKLMSREGNATRYERLIENIRNIIPHAVFRTTLITGFPGEGKAEFEELTAFIDRIRFNHVGVFVYSPQRETQAFKLHGRVQNSVAERRKKELLSRQRIISRELLQAEIGKSFDVLVEERVDKENIYFGRSYHFAPEVDGIFVVESKKEIEPGTIVKVRAESAEDYDLHGRIVRFTAS